MSKRLLFLFGLAALMFSGCCEDSYYYLPEPFHEVTVFGAGSRWIYRNNLSGESDTLEMLSSSLYWAESEGTGGCEGHHFVERLEQRQRSSYREEVYLLKSEETDFGSHVLEVELSSGEMGERLAFEEGGGGFMGKFEEIDSLEVDEIMYGGVFSETTLEDPTWFDHDVVRYYSLGTGLIRLVDLDTQESWDLIFVDVSPLRLSQP